MKPCNLLQSISERTQQNPSDTPDFHGNVLPSQNICIISPQQIQAETQSRLELGAHGGGAAQLVVFWQHM